MDRPCLSAAPPSYTEDTTNFPKGESAPPSRAMSSCPALRRVNQTINPVGHVSNEYHTSEGVSQYLFDPQQPHISAIYLLWGELLPKKGRKKKTWDGTIEWIVSKTTSRGVNIKTEPFLAEDVYAKYTHGLIIQRPTASLLQEKQTREVV